MSIEAAPGLRRRAFLAAVVAVLALPTPAAEVDFRPVLSFGVFHSGNVLFIGYDPETGQRAGPVADDIAAVAFDLAWDRRTPNSRLSFSYQPAYVKYRTRSDLDYFANAVALSYEKDTSRESRLETTLGATRTDFQGITAANADVPATYVPRTTLTRVLGTIGGSSSVAPRALLEWRVGVGVDRYAEIPNVVFNNSTAIAGRCGWQHRLNERTTLGLGAGIDWFNYDVASDYVSETLYFGGTHELGRYTSMTFDVGVTRTTTSGDSATSGALLLSFERELSAVSRLNAGIRQSVTPGTGLQAATSDSGAWVSYAPATRGRGIGGQIDGAYWYREVLQIGTATTGVTATLSLSGVLTWTFNRYLALDARYGFVDQNARGESASALDARYDAYGINLRWAINGKSDSRGVVAPFQLGH